MQFGALDKRSAIGVLAIAVLGSALIVQEFSSGSSSAKVSPGSAATIPLAEARLKHLRELASTVPAKEELAKKAKAELADREKGLLIAESEDQAKAKLLELTEKIARDNQIDVRGVQQWGDRIVSKDYAEVTALVQFNCGIEQLVNFMSALGSRQPELLSTSDLHISGSKDPKKNLQVRLTVTALAPRSLIPRKGGAKS
jgi:hypothetical protein